MPHLDEAIVYLMQSVTVGLVTLAIGFIRYIWKEQKRAGENRQEQLDRHEQEIHDIKYNYLDRFSKLETLFNQRFDELTDKIDEKYVTKEFCELQHKKS